MTENHVIGSRVPLVENVLDRNVIQLSPDASLRDAATALRTVDTSFATIGDGDRIDGVISERDLVQSIVDGLDPDATCVDAVDSVSLKWAATDASVDDVADEMLDADVRHVLVCGSDGRLVGVASMREVLRAYRL